MMKSIISLLLLLQTFQANAQVRSLPQSSINEFATSAYFQYRYGQGTFRAIVSKYLSAKGYTLSGILEAIQTLDKKKAAFNDVLDALYSFCGGSEERIKINLYSMDLKASCVNQITAYMIGRHPIQVADPVEESNEESEPVYTFVEKPPVFPGGDKALANYLSSNVKYPKEAVDNGISATIYISFVIDTSGYPTSLKVLGDQIGYRLEEEAMRVVLNMPQWIAGKQGGKSVSVRYTLPIKFSCEPTVGEDSIPKDTTRPKAKYGRSS